MTLEVRGRKRGSQPSESELAASWNCSDRLRIVDITVTVMNSFYL